MSVLNTIDLNHLKSCLDLAKEALDAGDEPFGSILVNEDNTVIASARNRINECNLLAHPEIKLAEWALENLDDSQRKSTTMYTTGEHCPMCAAAHGWAGIGTLVYLSSGEQLNEWLTEFGASPAPIHFIPVQQILKDVTIKGPARTELLDVIKNYHRQYHSKRHEQ